MKKNCANCKYMLKLTGFDPYDGVCDHTKHFGMLTTQHMCCSEYEYQGFTTTTDTEAKCVVGGNFEPDTLVFNLGNDASALLMTSSGITDLRQFNFDNIKCIEINGNKFFKENNNV